MVGSEVVVGKRNDGEVVVVDTCSLRAHNQWILIGEFIGTTSLGVASSFNPPALSDH